VELAETYFEGLPWGDGIPRRTPNTCTLFGYHRDKNGIALKSFML